MNPASSSQPYQALLLLSSHGSPRDRFDSSIRRLNRAIDEFISARVHDPQSRAPRSRFMLTDRKPITMRRHPRLVDHPTLSPGHGSGVPLADVDLSVIADLGASGLVPCDPQSIFTNLRFT